MKKTQIIATAVILLTLTGAAVWIGLQSTETQSEPTNQSTQTTNQPQTTPSSVNPSQNIDAYQDYTSDYLSTTSGTRLLFFHAPWCPQCRQLENDIISNGLPEGVAVIKVDYDSSQQLRQRYGVTLQTTVVRVDDNGDFVEKYVPYDSPTFANVAANLLDG